MFVRASVVVGVAAFLSILVLGCSGSSSDGVANSSGAPLLTPSPPATSEALPEPTATRPPRPTQTAVSEPTATPLPSPTPTHEPTRVPVAPGEIVVVPAGPYRDGQRVQLLLSLDQAVDIYNSGPLFCARVQDGQEYCDPTHLVGQRDEERLGGPRAIVEIPRRSFGPLGYQDCADAHVECRFGYRNDDGGFEMSPTLEYVGPATEPQIGLTATPLEIGGNFQLTIDGLPSNPSETLSDLDREWIQSVTSFDIPHDEFDFERLRFEWTLGAVCGFAVGSPPIGSGDLAQAPAWWGLHESQQPATADRPSPLVRPNCDFRAIEGDVGRQVDGPTTQVQIKRNIYGYLGWLDCAEVQCFISLRLRWFYGMPDGSNLGNDHAVAYALLNFDPAWPPSPLPSIRIVDPPPYRHGQQVTIEAANVRVDDGFESPSVSGQQTAATTERRRMARRSAER